MQATGVPSWQIPPTHVSAPLQNNSSVQSISSSHSVSILVVVVVGLTLVVVVVGGGPTGVEVSGTLAEMKKFILPKDYPELDFKLMNIYLLEAGSRLLAGMNEKSSVKAENYLNISESTLCLYIEINNQRRSYGIGEVKIF